MRIDRQKDKQFMCPSLKQCEPKLINEKRQIDKETICFIVLEHVLQERQTAKHEDFE